MKPLCSLLNIQMISKRIDADKMPENCASIDCVQYKTAVVKGNAQPTSLSDCTASLLSCTRAPKRKMGKLYAGAENGLMIKDNT